MKREGKDNALFELWVFASKNQNPREGIETGWTLLGSLEGNREQLQKTKIPARGLKLKAIVSTIVGFLEELQKTKIPARGLKQVVNVTE